MLCIFILSLTTTTAVAWGVASLCQGQSKKDCPHNCDFGVVESAVTCKDQKYYQQKQIPIIVEHTSSQTAFYHNMHHHVTKWVKFFVLRYANMQIWKHFLIPKQQIWCKIICHETQCSTPCPSFSVPAVTQQGRKYYALFQSVKCASLTFAHFYPSTKPLAHINWDICGRQGLSGVVVKARWYSTHWGISG